MEESFDAGHADNDVEEGVEGEAMELEEDKNQSTNKDDKEV